VEIVGYASFPVKSLNQQIFYKKDKKNSLIHVTSHERSTVCERFPDHQTHPSISTGEQRAKTAY